ncbi:hypothetical protein CPB86DRAFT_823893 [Serendipita vermifera]|nr:hypothetical protein CPB86DRAFT_823893 [Serendipita vermifera]
MPLPLEGFTDGDQFVISAGCILLKPLPRAADSSGPRLPHEYSLVYIRKRRNGEKVIAKGRKDVHEAIPDAAVRESYEETGYKSQILELPTPSLAPGSQDLEMNKEAIGITFRIDRMSRKDKAPIQKLIFWWVSEIDLDEEGNAVQRVEGTQLPYENYDVQEMTLDECLTADGLTFEPDRKLVAKTKELLIKRHDILTKKPQDSS